MTITLLTLRSLLSQKIGDDLSGTTTSVGNVNKLTLVSLDLKAATLSDDAFNGQWVLVTSGDCSGQERLISDFTQSTGTVTVDTAFSAQIISGITFEIHRYQPSKKKNFINRALEMSYPYFVKKYDDTTLVSGNALLNSNFEDWAVSNMPDNWAKYEAAGTIIISKETAICAQKRYGTASMKVVVSDTNTGNYIYQSQLENPKLLDFQDQEAALYCWVYASVASAVRLTVYSVDAAGTGLTTNSSYHTGGGQWEKLEIDAGAIIAEAVIVSIRLKVEKAGTYYFDNAYLLGRDIYEYAFPLGLEIVLQAYQGNDRDDIGYYGHIRLFGWNSITRDGIKYLRFDKLPDAGYKLRLVGYGYFTALSADTDSIDLDAKRGNIITDGAAALLLRSLVGSVKGTDAQRFKEESDKLEARFWALLERNQDVVSTLQTNIYTDSGED